MAAKKNNKPYFRHSGSANDGPPRQRFSQGDAAADPAVSVISTAHDGIRHGITVTSVTSVSMTPPSILFCVNRASRLHNPLVCAGHFCVNILHAHQIEIADAFSGRVAGEDRFLVGEWASERRRDCPI